VAGVTEKRVWMEVLERPLVVVSLDVFTNVQICNKLSFTVEIYMPDDKGQLKMFKYLEALDVVNLPNAVASSTTATLYFRPLMSGYVMMMMMMMMRRFVERVRHSPQDALSVPVKQVGLEMSSERQRRERCGLKGSWQTVPDVWGAATAKLLMPNVVVVLGMNSVPVSADRRCRLPAIAEMLLTCS